MFWGYLLLELGESAVILAQYIIYHFPTSFLLSHHSLQNTSIMTEEMKVYFCVSFFSFSSSYVFLSPFSQTVSAFHPSVTSDSQFINLCLDILSKN